MTARRSEHALNLGNFVFDLLLMFAVQSWRQISQTAFLDHSTLLTLLEKGEIDRVTVTETQIEGDLKTPIDRRSHSVTTRVEPDFADRLAAHEVAITGASDSTWVSTRISRVAPAAILVAFWAFYFRRFAERQGMEEMVAFGRSRAKVWIERNTGVTFRDVAGVDEAKAELQEVVSFLTDRRRYGRLVARVRKGILLVGPPATGKTLLARAVAGEAAVPFFSILGVGVRGTFRGRGRRPGARHFQTGAQDRVLHHLHRRAGRTWPGPRRDAGFGGNDEKEQTLNQLLAELDGFDPSVGIVLLAATNRT